MTPLETLGLALSDAHDRLSKWTLTDGTWLTGDDDFDDSVVELLTDLRIVRARLAIVLGRDVDPGDAVELVCVSNR